MKINSVFGEKSYSYQAITKSIRETSFTSSQQSIQKNNENYVHQQRIEIIKKILEDFPFFSLREIAKKSKIPKTTVYRILRKDLGYVLKHLK